MASVGHCRASSRQCGLCGNKTPCGWVSAVPIWPLSPGPVWSRLRPPMSARPRSALAASLGLLLVLGASSGAGCAGRSPARGTSCVWVAGRPEPAFDPAGPPDPLRWSLERLLARGLVEEDSSGALVPGAAERWEWSADSLTLTFHLRPGLAFADGSPCASADFGRALVAGLGREDHGSRAWLLGAVSGVERVRAGRPLPPLGVETPDARTLVLRLARRDPLLLAKLALPGLGAPWSAAAVRRLAGRLGARAVPGAGRGARARADAGPAPGRGRPRHDRGALPAVGGAGADLPAGECRRPGLAAARRAGRGGRAAGVPAAKRARPRPRARCCSSCAPICRPRRAWRRATPWPTA